MNLSVLHVVVFLFIASVNSDSDRCYRPEQEFYPFMGTRTAYELVHRNGSLRPESVSECKPLQIWVLARHGTKYLENEYKPTMLNLTKFRDQILDNHWSGDGNLCTRDLDNLRDWKLDPSLHDNEDENLAPQGRKDLLGLAHRLKKTFPELLQITPSTIVQDDYLFQTTQSQRTQQSMSSFIRGFLGDSNHLANIEVLPENNRLLLPHLNCPPWMKEYKEKELDSERKAFEGGPEVMQMLLKLTRKLGFQYTLDYDTVNSAYQMCRFEVAWYPDKISTWCTIFDKEDLKIFEYIEDLQIYYKEGPAREMAGKLGCPILADMLRHFKALETGNNTNRPKGIFHFGHSTTVRLFTTAMSVGKQNSPLTAKSYGTAQNRVFRTSKLGPFATNVLAVFYRCEGEIIEFKVSLHVAESPMPINDCENGICEWKFLKDKYSPTTESCNLDFCDMD